MSATNMGNDDDAIWEDTFWKMIEPEEYPCDCRLWLGEWSYGGYGMWSGPHLLKDKKAPRIMPNQVSAYRIAYEKSPWKKPKDDLYYVREICGVPQPKFDIGHICGLAPCCNPLHLMPVSRSKNIKDGWTHKWIFEGFTIKERAEIRESGMGFKEISRTLDIPGGVAFKLVHGSVLREKYPVPGKDYLKTYHSLCKPKKVEKPKEKRVLPKPIM